MSLQTLSVRSDDGTELELKIEARDALVWEKTAKGNPSILDYLRSPSMVELYRLAHIAMKRQQQYPGTLQEFSDSHDVNVYNQEDPEPDPTESAASADA